MMSLTFEEICHEAKDKLKDGASNGWFLTFEDDVCEEELKK